MAKQAIALEKELYPIVENWLKGQYECFKTGINMGLADSRADVIGVRDTGGQFGGEIETIVVEVKRNKEPFSTASGQARGYSIYANRVFLADRRDDRFSSNEIRIADHLGIGLIQINKDNSCQEVLTSPYHKSLTSFSKDFLHRLCLVECQICNRYFDTGENLKGKRHGKLVEIENYERSTSVNKGIKISLEQLRLKTLRYGFSEKRFICPNCAELLFSRK